VERFERFIKANADKQKTLDDQLAGEQSLNKKTLAAKKMVSV